MIATLRGEISQIEETALIIEVGGVGLRVFVPAPLRTRSKAGDAAFLFTHLVVREDALTLYGFESQADRELYHHPAGRGWSRAKGGALGLIHPHTGCDPTGDIC